MYVVRAEPTQGRWVVTDKQKGTLPMFFPSEALAADMAYMLNLSPYPVGDSNALPVHCPVDHRGQPQHFGSS